MEHGRLDVIAVAASGLCLTMFAVYLSVMRRQGDEPATWAVVAFTGCVAASAYGAVARAPYRRPALALAGSVLVVVGILAILSIGLPVLIAGALCLVAAVRRQAVPKP